MSFNNDKSYNLNSPHTIIPNSQEYVYYKKYISIHSEDRDMLKYPNSSNYEIELPEDYLNVVTVRLSSWSFPSNYNAFSTFNTNIDIVFKIIVPYNPGEHGLSNVLQNAIFEALYYTKDTNYYVTITEGFYTPIQMANELTNKFNEVVTARIVEYFNNNGWDSLLPDFYGQGGYNQFVIAYNTVKQKITFGNRSSQFFIDNKEILMRDKTGDTYKCLKSQLPDYSNWGLPGYIGLDRINYTSETNTNNYCRFYYGDYVPGDNGYWLTPDPNLNGSSIYFIECPNKINLMGPAYFYMEIDGLNCIDETSPYSYNYTLRTNETNSIVNSSLAKIAIPTTPNSQWFDENSQPYKLFNPPAERIRKLRVRLRYHNGQLVNFSNCEYSFTLELTLYISQQLRQYKLFQPALGKPIH